MRYRLAQIKTEIDEPVEKLPAHIAKALRIKESDIKEWELRRRSIDSRKKPHIQYVYTVDFVTDRKLNTAKNRDLSLVDAEAEAAACKAPSLGSGKMKNRPVVVGVGPAGLFAALELAKAGYRPLVLERGPAMHARIQAVERFREHRVLDPEGNMLFGEGGAGTFSDGKLGTGIKDGLIRKVLAEFRDAGAGDDIMYLAKPHIGTDVLREVIVNMRNKITELGGEVRFDTRVDRLVIKDGAVEALELTGPEKQGAGSEGRVRYRLPADNVILAIGHSARDTFSMLNAEHVAMEQKPFSIGVRMEHPQALIDAAQYGEENVGRLPPADYKINYKASNGRGVYSFCMCPGGEVVVCSNEEGELCVNGMSNRKRDSGTANSGILCDVRTEDFGSDDVLAGVELQRKYERLAFINGGGDFTAPSCSMKGFVGERYYIERYGRDPEPNIVPDKDMNRDAAGNSGNDLNDDTAGSPGNDPYKHRDLFVDEAEFKKTEAVRNSLPDFAAEAIREAVSSFAHKIHGYDDPDAVITAVETRSSSPVRILRGEDGQSNIRGLYPAGEGAGYAGGITSAACDGIRAAWHIIESYSPIDSRMP